MSSMRLACRLFDALAAVNTSETETVEWRALLMSTLDGIAARVLPRVLDDCHERGGER